MATDEPTNTHVPRDGDTEDMLPVRGIQSPPTIHRANRRPLGLGPVRLLGGGLVLTLVLAIVLVAAGSWPVGAVLFAVALVLLAFVLVAVEHEPDDPAARAAIVAADRARSSTRLIRIAARAWSGAGLAVVRLRERRYRLRWRLRRQIQPLGEAAYAGDEARVKALRADAERTEAALREAERKSAAAVAAARAEIERERAPTQATTSLPVQQGPDTESQNGLEDAD